MSYTMQPHPDKMRWSVLDEKGREYGTYNSQKVAKAECRRLNGEPPEISQEALCRRFDAKEGLAVMPCRVCSGQIHDGDFFYFVNGRIVCDSCQEGGKLDVR